MSDENLKFPRPAPVTAKSLLQAAQVKTDDFYANDRGELEMGGMRLVDLVSRFGSPLFVLSDTTLRRNFRRFKSAFVQHWPSSVEVLYAVKANPNPVVCRELANERAGFDCTGFGELELALRYGETPAITTLNGSNKSETEIAKAIAAEAIIVLDAEDDVALVKRQAELQQKIAKVILRLKAFDSSRLSGFQSDAYPSAYDAAMVVARKNGALDMTPQGVLSRRYSPTPGWNCRGITCT